MPRRLPLFPLDTVLFPGARIALHIFEPRYQELLADCLGGDQTFGILSPEIDGELPPTGSLGCVARIVAHQPLGDGRSTILVSGESRFILRRWSPDGNAYPVGLVELFADEEGTTEIPADAMAALQRLADRCRTALRILADSEGVEEWAPDPETFTFQVAGQLPWESEPARQLLSMRSAAQRADLLLTVLPRIIQDLESRAAIHRRASSNGKGPHLPETGSAT